MRPFRHAGSSILFLMLSAGAFGACSSSSGSPNDAGSSTDVPADKAATDAPAGDTTVADAAGFDYPSIDGAASPNTMTLTSSALTEGAVFAAANTCAGVNTSPPLTWSAGPSGTMSYAVVLSDLNNVSAHWVIWDIPPDTRQLTESLPTGATLTTPAGAKQAAGSGMGYLGPCPSGALHTYVFTLYAMDVAMLPGVTASSMTAALATAIKMHQLAAATLSATSDAKKP